MVRLRNARLYFRQIEEVHIMENIIYNELRSRVYQVEAMTADCGKEGKMKRSDVMRVLDMKASLFFRRPGAARLLAIYRRIHLQVLAC